MAMLPYTGALPVRPSSRLETVLRAGQVVGSTKDRNQEDEDVERWLAEAEREVELDERQRRRRRRREGSGKRPWQT